MCNRHLCSSRNNFEFMHKVKHGNINPPQNMFLMQVYAGRCRWLSSLLNTFSSINRDTMPGSVLSISIFRILNHTCFSMTKRALRKKTTMRVPAQKTQHVMAKLRYWNYFPWRNLWKTVPFVAKMMAKIRNISVIKPRVAPWAMFLQSVPNIRQACEYILKVFFLVCSDVIALSIITWLSVGGKVWRNNEKPLSGMCKMTKTGRSPLLPKSVILPCGLIWFGQ